MHKALGRGLESLISTATTPAVSGGESVHKLDVSKIKPNKYQPRLEFNKEKLNELAQSIKTNGLAQPLIVTQSVIPGEYELIAGERRLRACKIAGIKEIACVVRKANEKEKFQLSLIENIQREDLNPMEEAHAYGRLSKEFNLTQEKLAEVLGKNRSVVANSLRLLNLPKEIQEMISSGFISAGHARMLAGLDDKSKQKNLAERIMHEKLTVREVEKIVADWKSVLTTHKKKAKRMDAELVKLMEDLQRKLGTKIKIIGKPSKGKIEIHYYSLKDLERIAGILKGKKK